MTSMPVASARIGLAFALLMVVLPARVANAQAWLPAQGEGAVSFVFQDTLSKYHYTPTRPVDRGHMRSETFLVDVTYGIRDDLAVSVGIPWVMSKYTGAFPHPLASNLSQVSPLDNGNYHSTFQDFRFDVRYNVMKRGVVVTPFVGTLVPSHDYIYFAHAAPGRSLKELQVGLVAAKLLDRLVPGLFVQGRYSYGFTEKVRDISHNRSNMDFEVGYFLTPSLRLLGLAAGQYTHGGIDLTGNLRATNLNLFLVHDQVQRDHQLNLGGGVAYALTEKIDLFSSLVHTVAKRNGHATHYGATVGVGWSFSTRSKDRAVAQSAERTLLKCLCEKGS